MLLQFAVANYRSFRQEEVLSLVPSKRRKAHQDHILHATSTKSQALPLAALYGANAAGKSNLVRAMRFATHLITHGTSGNASTGVVPFRLDPALASQPSRFEFALEAQGVVYRYGFAATRHEICEEWLWGSGRAPLFERETRDHKTEIRHRLAGKKKDRQRLDFVAAGTRPNQLFLTEAIDRNVEELAPLKNFFHQSLFFIEPDSVFEKIIDTFHGDSPLAKPLEAFLRSADTGILSVQVESRPFDPSHFSPQDRAMLQKQLRGGGRVELGIDEFAFSFDHNLEGVARSLKTEHLTTDRKSILFDAVDESDGTRRLMHLGGSLFWAAAQDGAVVVIDELDRSLHARLSRLFIETFLAQNRGGKSAQLIFTTHDTSLLDAELLRHDEVWFVEKDAEGGSHLSSLVDFKVPADLQLSKGYLNGRFGAIPYVGAGPTKLGPEFIG